jgi:hypothetical protein
MQMAPNGALLPGSLFGLHGSELAAHLDVLVFTLRMPACRHAWNSDCM